MPSSNFEIDSQQRALRLARLVQQIRANLAGRSLRPFADMLPAPENLSKRKLSRLLGVSPTLINKYESGEIDPWEIRWGLMRRLARLAELSLEQLDATLSGDETYAQQPGQEPRSLPPHELIASIRTAIDRLEISLEQTQSTGDREYLVPWFGRYLRTLLADQARESRKTLSDLTESLIAALPSADPERDALLRKVLEGQAELTDRQIEAECVGLAAALSAVIEVPVTAGQLLALLPDSGQRSQLEASASR
ncbi:helix-turn-helix domain-containing protein [Synechococcus elongatus]|uniref:Helix-turn-helix transcriptional regulator n=2 Tax=Synechococcus elongatus TaxID=32046 RepID=A0AAN1UUN8_SYNEL|nr:helix-turn-helix transcriptional regulator [Synechococcus elongatus]AZB72821.1 XRE family transcriptional regulator [Synechococcus elongatus PCC 11801]QFZ92538.1 XRE family transcriptional regulator [Synechococcus elongatus PCC 11802]